VVTAAPGRLTATRPVTLPPGAPAVGIRANQRVVAMVATTLGLLAAGFVLQLVVYGHGGHSSISDLPRVFLHRGVGPGALPYVDKVLEYPVGAGMLMYLAALVAPTPFGVLTVTAIVAAALCVAITVVLERHDGARAWRWAVGMPVMLYAFQNWDVFAIAALLVGILAFEAHRDRLSGAALGLGAAIKLFPAVVLPPLVALRWARGDRRGALRLAGSSGAVLLVCNLPFLVANPSGWRWTLSFQGARQATWGSAEFYLLRVVGAPVHGATGSSVANLASFAVLAAGIGGLTVLAYRRPLTAAGVAGAAVAIFLLSNKVFSPTYDIWLLIFFVLLPVSRRLWLTFCAVDLAVFVTVYGHFHAGVTTETLRVVLPALVAVRTAVLVTLVVHAVRDRAPAALVAGEAQSVKNPPSGCSSSPVKYEDSSLARNATVLAISEG
jgi:uncharacterized membrane protein